MKYIHYGHDKFEKERFQEIKNRPYMTKPFGGFWASRKNSDEGWKDWVAENELTVGNFNSSFEFSLKKDAKILLIDNIDTLSNLPKVNSDISLRLWSLLDFEKCLKIMMQ